MRRASSRTARFFRPTRRPQALPADRYIVGTCPHCGHLNARGDQWRAAPHARPRGTSLAALGNLRRHRRRIPRDPPSVPKLRPSKAGCVTGSRPDATGQPRPLDRAEMARRRPARPLHHPRPGLGRAGAQGRLRGQGLLRLVRRAHRLHRRAIEWSAARQGATGAIGGSGART